MMTKHSHRRRATSLTFVAIGMIAFLGFAVLAIDLGYLYITRGELQRNADAAALAGASAYVDLCPLLQPDTVPYRIDEGRARAMCFAHKNLVARAPITLASADIDLGYLANPWDATAPFDRSDPALFNAIRVSARRTGDSPNGALPLFLAHIFGTTQADVGAAATAVLDDRFTGFAAPSEEEGSSPLVPFALYEGDYERLIVDRQGSDVWGAAADGTPLPISDGIPEIKIYPQKLPPGQQEPDYDGLELLPSNPKADAAGNFAILNIGVHSMSEILVEEQIREGIHAEDMIDELGEPFIDFFDQNGGQIVHPIGGNPGIKVGMRDALDYRLGDVVGFFLFREVVDPGSNTIFQVTGLRFGRVMFVRLVGNAPNKSAVVIQPCVYVGEGVRTDPDAPSSGGLIAKLMLIR